MEAAAITAVVQYVLDNESAARSKPPSPSVPSAWVRLGTAAPFGRFVAPVAPGPGRNSL
jgi:hypothetical protein